MKGGGVKAGRESESVVEYVVVVQEDLLVSVEVVDGEDWGIFRVVDVFYFEGGKG